MWVGVVLGGVVWVGGCSVGVVWCVCVGGWCVCVGGCSVGMWWESLIVDGIRLVLLATFIFCIVLCLLTFD